MKTISTLIILIFTTLIASAQTTAINWKTEGEKLVASALETAESVNIEKNVNFIREVEKFQRKSFMSILSAEEKVAMKESCERVAKATTMVKDNLDVALAEVKNQSQELDKDVIPGRNKESYAALNEFSMKLYTEAIKRLETVIKKLTDQSK
jgi:hypothetical protein